MEKIFLILAISFLMYVGFKLGEVRGRSDSMKDFNNQIKSHQTFYEHNLRTECSKRKFYVVTGE